MNETEKPKLIVICGPTGIGKTALSLSLAEEFNGAIVGADSMQIYKHMDIGTAKPDESERSRIPHFLIDVINPDEAYDAVRYSKEAREFIFMIHKQAMVPFVIGGTGFYIKALLHGLFKAQLSDPKVRKKFRDEAEQKGSKRLHEALAECDKISADRIHPNDTYRIIRALEINEITGRAMSELQKEHSFKENLFDELKICLDMDRDKLYERINQRVDQMISQGLLEEVKNLLKMGYSEDLQPMKAIGYRHMVDYINDRVSWEEAIETLKRDTRRYAKRQLTWFKKDKDIIWKHVDKTKEIKSIIEKFIKSK